MSKLTYFIDKYCPFCSLGYDYNDDEEEEKNDYDVTKGIR